jgi:hypothetical protein
MESHISVHRATTNFFSNSFVFKNEIEKEGLPRDSTPDLGAGGPGVQISAPDQQLTELSDYFFPRYSRTTRIWDQGF